jgi:O-antigen ligase
MLNEGTRRVGGACTVLDPHTPRRTLTESSAYWLVVALMVGSLLGAGVLVLGPLVVMGGIAATILLVLSFRFPEVDILVLLCLAAGVIPEQFNLFVRLPVGRVQLSDLLLSWLLFVAMFRVLTDKSFRWVKTPLDAPVALFVGAVFGGMATAVLGFGISISDASYEARTLMYYLIFFVITNLVRRRSQLIRLVRGVLAIGLVLAGMMLAEAALGRSLPFFESWRSQEGGLVRLNDPGFTTVFVVLMVLVSRMALHRDHRHSLFLGIQVLVLGAAIVTTLARNLLVSAGVGIGLLVAVLPWPQRRRLALYLLGTVWLLGLLGGGLATAGREGQVVAYTEAYAERLGRMVSPKIVEQGENLVSRWAEIQAAWVQIARHPFLGIGLNTPYRPAFFRGEDPNLRTYIHNAYLAIWLKTGLVGLVSFLWLACISSWRGLSHWRNEPSEFLRATALGFILAFVGMMFSNLVAPSFVQPGSLVIFGVVLGTNEAVFAQNGVSGT